MSSNVQETSKDAFHELTNIGPKQQVVLAYFEIHGPMTDKQIVNLTGWPVSSVTARRNELVKNNLVREKCKIRDPKSGKTVILWEAVP